jgi:hypothetical protein
MALPQEQTLIGVTFIDGATVSYDDFTFDASRQVMSDVVPIYGDDGFTLTNMQRTYTIKGVVYNSDNVSNFAEHLKTYMMRPGKTFTIQNAGIADIVVTGYTDTADGPRPMNLSLEPIGFSRAFAFTFVIRITLPPACDNGQDLAGRNGIARAYNYTIDWNINDGQFSTRTISGHVEIYATRAGSAGGNPSNSADEYRETIAALIPMLPQFHRTQHYRESIDKRRLEFLIVDREIDSPNVYPKGCTHIRGNHQTRWVRGKSGATIGNSLSVEVQLDPRANPILGLVVFLEILFARIDNAKTYGVTVFLDSLNVGNELFSYNQSYSASWRLLGSIKKESTSEDGILGPGYITIGGVFMQTPQVFGEGFDGWKQWQEYRAVSPRGLANLTDHGAAFGGASACEGITDEGTREDHLKVRPFFNVVGDGVPGRELGNALPPPGDSYLHYDNGIMTESKWPNFRTPYTQENPYGEPDDTENYEDDSTTYGGDWGFSERSDDTENNPLGSTGNASQNNGNTEANARTDPGENMRQRTKLSLGGAVGTNHDIQVSGIEEQTYRMVGSALRVGYPVSKPNIAKLGNKRLIPVSTKFYTKQVMTMFGQPVYGAAWSITYIADNSPGLVALPLNFQQEQVNGNV